VTETDNTGLADAEPSPLVTVAVDPHGIGARE
jgi:hypothetical protein